jgi:hypothetical protein
MSTLKRGKIGNALLDASPPRGAVRGIPAGQGTGPQDERALRRMLASGRGGYWAMLTVRVDDLAVLDGEWPAAVVRSLAAHLREILDEDVSIYRSGGGLAILAGPGEDLPETRNGTLLLKMAIERKLTEPFFPHTAISPLTFSVETSTDRLSRLRPDSAERKS